MKSLTLFLATVLSGSAVADLTFSATAVSKGKQVDWKSTGVEFVPIPQRSRFHHNSNGGDETSTKGSPPGKGRPHNRNQKRATTASLSSNWCGISQKAPSTSPITNVYSYFTAPDLSLRPGYSYPQYGASWIGIDGGSCKTALLQAGVSTVLNSNGGQSASAWFEWVPLASYSITGYPVKAGDWLEVNITATSVNDAVIVMNNLNQEYSLTISLGGGPTLCRAEADWIYEDFYNSTGQEVTFARFQDVWFEEASATTADGTQIGLDNASLIYLGASSSAVTCVARPYDNSNFWCESQG